MTQALKNMQAKNQERIIAFANWIIKRRWIVLAGTLMVALAAGSGGRFLGFNSDYHAFFGENNPQLNAYEELQNKYTKDDNVFIVIDSEDGKVFTKKTLAAIEELTSKSWQTPYSSRVDAITNYQHTRAIEDDLYVDDLIQDAANYTDEQLAYAKEVAVNEPFLLHRLINKEGSVTAVNITVKLPGKDQTEGAEIIKYVREMTSEFESKNPGLKTYTSGMIMLSGAFFESSQRDMSTLMPLMFLAIILTIFIFTRNIGSTFASLLIIILSIATAMGIAGWLGIKLTPASAPAPTMIMTLAIADSIHILITMLQFMRRGNSKREAIVESLRVNFMPVFITSLTTIIGFLTLNFSDSPPFHDLGNITAIGMTFAFTYSILTLPAIIAILPVKVKVKEEEKDSNEYKGAFINKVAEFVVTNNKKTLWLGSLSIILVSLLMFKNELNDEFIEYFDETIQFRTDTDFISENLTGIYTAEFSLGSGEEGGINNPEYLQKVEGFKTWLEEKPEVIHVNSYTTVAKRVNKSMHGDDPSYYKIPEERNEAAQYLLLYEMSLPFGLDLNNQINVDKSETRMTVTVENISSSAMVAFTTRAENWLRDNAPESMYSNGSSSTIMFSHLTRRQIDSMISGGIMAIVLISLILMFALRSVRHGLLSLIPNIAPIAVGFGIWGLTVGTVNSGIAVVFGMTLGIIVDDTVHFLSKYLRARREKNMSPEDAVRYAFNTVGQALIVTTIVLAFGFMVLAQSSFGMNSGMGKITNLIIILALFIDFLILPAILIRFDRSRNEETVDSPENLTLAN